MSTIEVAPLVLVGAGEDGRGAAARSRRVAAAGGRRP